MDVANGGDVRKKRSKGRVPDIEPWLEGLEKYRNGALRITRTPGRAEAGTRNCVELRDLLKPESLEGMWACAFFLEYDFFSPHVPVDGSGEHARRDVPIYFSRDFNQDPLRLIAAARAGLDLPLKNRRYSKEQEDKIVPELCELWQHIAGPNWKASYPYASGCAHPKALVLKYPGFLLVVITSCNFMRIDMELSDNHWFIMSFPLLVNGQTAEPTEFEAHLLHMMGELDCPDSFVRSIRGKYDYSATVNRVHLVLSTPGVKTGGPARNYGVLRLGELAKELISPRLIKEDRIALEICIASLGTLKDEWAKKVDWVLKGKGADKLAKLIDREREDKLSEPEWTVVYPTKKTVNECSEEVQVAASNIGCAIRTSQWDHTPLSTRSMFHDYRSKDCGRLFHQKSILWLDKLHLSFPSSPPSSTSIDSSSPSVKPSPPPPLMLYLGSHNFSKAAWGTPSSSGGGEPKLSDVANYELGVVVKGSEIEGLLEEGSSWEEAVTYERPARRYGEDDKPWNSRAWVKSK
ncbi:hypothetical protein JCM8547_000103 [Rhodosporidiobolus lusitaniae]